MSQSATVTLPPIGSVSENEALTLAEIEARIGLGRAAVREARRKGLKVRRVGNRRIVLGRDLLAYCESIEPEESRGRAAGLVS